jgi:signal transduction histidine kinase
MRSATTPRSIHWIVIIIRWVFLITIGLRIGFKIGYTKETWGIALLLGTTASLNFFATMLLGAFRRKRSYRLVSVIGDIVFAYLMYRMVGPYYADLSWIGLMPLISASLYYRWAGAIILILLNTIVQGLITWILAPLAGLKPLAGVLSLLSTLFPVYVIVGVFFAILSQLLSEGLQGLRNSANIEMYQRETERRRAIYNLISALSSSLNYQRVLETALDLSGKTLAQLDVPVDKLVSVVFLFAENERKEAELQVGSARRLPPSDLRITLPGTGGLIGRAIDEGKPVLSRNISNDPDLNRFLALQDCRSAYCIPLRMGLEAYGILFFAHPDPEFFAPNRSEILDIVGNQSVIALQNARLYRDLEQEKERMMEIQEEARKKIARDLHDGPTQSVAAIAMRVNFARRLMERDTKAASEELYKIEDLARRTTKEIRHMLFTLRPLVLESQGLVAALESMAEKMSETYNQEVIIQADQRVVDELEASKQAVVFYIAEEAVTNARKHAQAPHIWVRLKLLRDGLSLLEVEDDGVGFNVGAVDSAYESRGSLGMVNMRERAELVNGVLRIDSAMGRGTRVQVIIPLTEEAADRLRRNL